MEMNIILVQKPKKVCCKLFLILDYLIAKVLQNACTVLTVNCMIQMFKTSKCASTTKPYV